MGQMEAYNLCSRGVSPITLIRNNFGLTAHAVLSCSVYQLALTVPEMMKCPELSAFRMTSFLSFTEVLCHDFLEYGSCLSTSSLRTPDRDIGTNAGLLRRLYRVLDLLDPLRDSARLYDDSSMSILWRRSVICCDQSC